VIEQTSLLALGAAASLALLFWTRPGSLAAEVA
jgi:hypothetical protein